MWSVPPSSLPEGPSPDTPRKRGLARLLEILGRDLGSLYAAGLLILLAGLPTALLVGTALYLGSLPLCLLAAAATGWLTGPPLAGFYDTALRALRDEPGYWWHTYHRAWRRNFKETLIPGSVFCTAQAALLYLIFVLPRRAALPASLALVIWADAALVLALGSYFWLQAAMLDCSNVQRVQNCIRMAVGFLPQTLAAACVQLAYWLCIAWIVPRCAFVFLLTGVWLPHLLALMILYPPIERALHWERH